MLQNHVFLQQTNFLKNPGSIAFTFSTEENQLPVHVVHKKLFSQY